jgi:hypothetical protein
VAKQHTVSILSGEAAGSTSQGASIAQCIVCFGFWKAKDEAHPFVSNPQLILVESQNKSK